jgi:hypothetical protein
LRAKLLHAGLVFALVGCALTGNSGVHIGPAAVAATPASPPTPVVAPEGSANPVALVAPPELPRGGRTIFPRYRLVGYCGTPGAPELGALQGNLAARAKDLTKLAESYAGDREALPTFELIAVLVMGAAGPDKTWRRRVPASVVDDYLAAARASKALLLLNIQPGHSDFLTEVRSFERWLREPDVGVALDPEWAMWKPDQVPGSVYGQTTGEVINDVAAYMADLVRENDLPEKPLVFHQVNDWVLKNEAGIRSHSGIVVIKSVDGLGFTRAKINTYRYLVKSLDPNVHPGFKLFYDEDVRFGGRLMAPKEVMALSPVPDYVMYE